MLLMHIVNSMTVTAVTAVTSYFGMSGKHPSSDRGSDERRPLGSKALVRERPVPVQRKLVTKNRLPIVITQRSRDMLWLGSCLLDALGHRISSPRELPPGRLPSAPMQHAVLPPLVQGFAGRRSTPRSPLKRCNACALAGAGGAEKAPCKARRRGGETSARAGCRA